MTVYLTKVWGFSVPCGPLQFSKEGWRDKARAELQPGDLVVLVGTKGEQTDKECQGRVLGIMEPTTHLVLSRDYNLETREVDFDDEGKFRWPYGLLNRRAWEIGLRPLLHDISDRTFSMDAASGIVPLTDEEEARVMQLERVEVDLLLPVRARARIEGQEAARRRGAPPPTTQRTGIMHIRKAPAYTYAMGIKGASQVAFKIGWAFDYKQRQRQFNLYALPELSGLKYQAHLDRLWDTAREAFRMEQAILRHFDASRYPANREVIIGVKVEQLETAWITYLQTALGQGTANAAKTSSPTV
jgi:hypothetical protein